MANKRIKQIIKAIRMTISPTDILVMVRNNATGLLNAYVIPESDYDTFRREYGDDIVEWMTNGDGGDKCNN